MWYFSVADIVGALIEQEDPIIAGNYWRKLKQRLKEEGSEVVTNCHDLKMQARARENWLKHGRSKQWIQQRMMGQEIRNKRKEIINMVKLAYENTSDSILWIILGYLLLRQSKEIL